MVLETRSLTSGCGQRRWLGGLSRAPGGLLAPVGICAFCCVVPCASLPFLEGHLLQYDLILTSCIGKNLTSKEVRSLRKFGVWVLGDTIPFICGVTKFRL